MDKIKRILINEVKPFLLYLVGETNEIPNPSMRRIIPRIDASELRKIINNGELDNLLRFICDIDYYSSSVSKDEMIRILSEDGVNLYKIYSFLDKISIEDSCIDDTPEIDSYLDFISSIGNDYKNEGKRFSTLLSMASYNRNIEVRKVSISDLESLVLSDIDSIRYLSSKLNNYRLDDVEKVYDYIKGNGFKSEGKKLDKSKELKNKLISILNSKKPSNEILTDINNCISDKSFNKSSLSLNLRYILDHPVLSLMQKRDIIDSITSLIKRY